MLDRENNRKVTLPLKEKGATLQLPKLLEIFSRTELRKEESSAPTPPLP